MHCVSHCPSNGASPCRWTLSQPLLNRFSHGRHIGAHALDQLLEARIAAERVQHGFQFQHPRPPNATKDYRHLFARVFPDVKEGGPITFDHFASAIAEFEFTQVYTNAPIDRYARGDANAMTTQQKLGAVLFFGRAGCVQCHAVSGQANEMFSDFRQHVAGIPQVAPTFGNVDFDGPGADEDFGLEQVTGDPHDRYAFRTSPLRNAGLQAAFMHNGAFLRLEDAIRYHVDARGQAASYTTALLPPDLQGPIGPVDAVLERLDPLLSRPVKLTSHEFDALVEFVRNGLLDPDARPQRLRRFIPEKLPSGRPHLIFQFLR